MQSKQLLVEMIRLAQQQATEQLQDVWHLSAYTEEKKPDVYLQLDIHDHANRGGRYVGEPHNATGVNRNNREGEYKFWDESNMKLFWKIDGMPTATRALLYTMRKIHEISETPDVWMGFVGSIDKELGPAKPCRFRLQSILKPLKLWDKLSEKYSGLDKLAEVTGGELSASYCQPFWEFAFVVIRCAPHMLKAGYKTYRKDNKMERFSWALLLVLLFLPQEELMKELIGAGLAPKKPPVGWHQQARKQMKEALMGNTRARLRASIRNGWDELCRELDELYFENDLYTDFPVPPPPLRDDSEDEQVSERPQNESRDVQVQDTEVNLEFGLTRFQDQEGRTNTQGKKSKVANANRVSSAGNIKPTTTHYPRYQHRPPTGVQESKKRIRVTSESGADDIANGEKALQRKKQHTSHRRPSRWDFSDDDVEWSQDRVRDNEQLSNSLEQAFQAFALKGTVEASGKDNEETAGQKAPKTKEVLAAEVSKGKETPKEKEIARARGTLKTKNQGTGSPVLSRFARMRNNLINGKGP
ncbi:hypothetical protein SLS60_010043 [Paraconiothyrium brasiliense]|uniref:Uncharacterized protein n=1 Tax=Paraconiothyrium brasiliense TaxID=300254 RepID=A0ABR3QQ60_9PLEO